MDESKPCRACGETKPVTEFHRKHDSRDGLMGICKPCACAKTRRYAAEAGKEAIAEKDRRYREANKERVQAREAAYRARNKEVLLERSRARYAAADESARERQRQLVRDWIRSHPEQMASHYRTKRARRKRALTGPVDLAALWVGACGLCGEPIDADVRWPDPMSKSIDLIVPLAKGGTHTQDNLQWAHLRCNISKGARLIT